MADQEGISLEETNVIRASLVLDLITEKDQGGTALDHREAFDPENKSDKASDAAPAQVDVTNSSAGPPKPPRRQPPPPSKKGGPGRFSLRSSLHTLPQLLQTTVRAHGAQLGFVSSSSPISE